MKSDKKAQSLGVLLQQFFTHYLQEQRDVSQCTVASYRDTFRLLLVFTEQQLGRRPAELSLSDINAKLVLSFLLYLEKRDTILRVPVIQGWLVFAHLCIL